MRLFSCQTLYELGGKLRYLIRCSQHLAKFQLEMFNNTGDDLQIHHKCDLITFTICLPVYINPIILDCFMGDES